MAETNVGGIEYTVSANTKPLLDANVQAQASTNQLGNTLESVGKSTNKFDAAMKKSAASVKVANAGFSSMKGSVQNLGYQLQDVAVQAQMGTSALTILGQQGSQILSVFGAGGAIAGAGLAIGAALAGVIAKAMGAADEIKDLNTEMELLQQTVKVTDSGLTVMTDGFSKLAAKRPEEAISKLKVELDRTDQIMGIVSKDTNSMINGFDTSSYFISVAAKEMDSFRGSAQDLADTVNEKTLFGFVDSAEAARKGVGRLQDVVVIMNDTFGITTQESMGLVRALKDLKTPEGIINASKYVSQLALSSTDSNVNLNKLAVNLGEAAQKAENLTASQEALLKAISDIQKAMKNNETEMTKNVAANQAAEEAASDLENQIRIQKKAMEEGEEAAIRLSVAINLGARVSEETKKKVADLAVEYYRLVESQKTAQQAQKDQDTVNKNAAKLAEQIRVSNLSEIDQIKEKAQAQRDLIRSSTDLNDVQKELAIADISASEQGQISDIRNREQFGTTDPNQIMLQQGLNVSQEMAAQIDTLDKKFQNLATTINDQTVGAVYNLSDAFGQQMAQNIAQGESLDKGLRDIANTIGTQLLGQLISLGLQYGINALLAQSASAAVTATTTAEAASLQAAWAPAATSASIATLGTASGTGLAAYETAIASSQSVGIVGGRLNGGPVNAGSMYQVTENGQPELLTVGNKQMLMMGNRSGTVTSNKDMMAAGTGGIQVINNVYNNSSGAEVTTSASQNGNVVTIETLINDLNSNGKFTQALTKNTSTNYKSR